VLHLIFIVLNNLAICGKSKNYEAPSDVIFSIFPSTVSSLQVIVLYGEVLLEGHPFSAVRDSLFNIAVDILHISRHSFHRQPEDAPRYDRQPTPPMGTGDSFSGDEAARA
jgi:hypothetical protein